jgi:hypothetical protein
MLISTEVIVMVAMALTLLLVAGVWAVTVPDVIRVEAGRSNHRMKRP